jgi:hypothetical protein
LIFLPSGGAQFLNVRVGGARGIPRNLLDINQQSAFGGRQAGLIEFAFQNCSYALIGGSLNTQEVSMAVESIGAAIEERDVAGDHLLVAAGEMTFRKVNFIGEFDHLAKKIGPRAETFDDAGDLLTSRAGTPEIVGGGYFPCGFCVFGDADFCGLLAGGSIRNRVSPLRFVFLICGHRMLPSR